MQKTAIAYYRTSSTSGVGDDKDSQTRQRMAVSSYAKTQNIKIIAEYYDAAVKGTDDISDRPEFSKMIGFIADNKVDMVLVETVNRFARDLIVQMTGHQMLKDMGVMLVPVDIPDYFVNETPTAVMVRQILGAVSQFEKAALVEKLRAARERKKAITGWCGGPKPVPPATVALAKQLAKTPKTLRAIAAEMAHLGHLAPSGKPYGPESVKRMVARG